MTYIPREIESLIEKHLKSPQIIAIVGSRRSGKTTLLTHLKTKLKNSHYLSFEDQKVLDLFQKDVDSFIKLHLHKDVDYLLIDEFQYAKLGGKKLKYIYDFMPGKKIIISGSSAIDITIQAVKHLVGRVVVLNLFQFSFSEFLSVKNKELNNIYKELYLNRRQFKEIKISEPLMNNFNALLEEYIIFGGYPEVVLENDIELKKTFLSNIYSILFLREVKDLLSLVEDYKLKLLLKSIALQIGSVCIYQELSIQSSISLPTVKKYLNFFEKTFISLQVFPYFTNKRVELIKNPKAYFFDTGFRNAVIDNFSNLNIRNDMGSLKENFASISFMKEGKLNYWRTKAGAEVDFIIEKEGAVIPIEIKSLLAKEKISKSMASFIAKYKPVKAIIFSNDLLGKQKVNSTIVYYYPLFLA
jgi:predicted AAA+ superfamily ATPase